MLSGAGRREDRVLADDVEAELAGLCQSARDIVGAEYAALGILDAGRHRLEHFVTAGLEEPSREAIGAHPRGRGVLGVLVSDPGLLRIEDLTEDARSYGFPDGHPEMHDFMGAPVMLDGEACGNLYLSGKRQGAFDEVDEQLVSAMAERAAAIVRSAR
jgi:GAF domain-containing protein